MYFKKTSFLWYRFWESDVQKQQNFPIALQHLWKHAHLCMLHGFLKTMPPILPFSCVAIHIHIFISKDRQYLWLCAALLTDIYINEAKYKHRWFPPTDEMEHNNVPSESTVLQIPRGRNQNKKKSDYSRWIRVISLEHSLSVWISVCCMTKLTRRRKWLWATDALQPSVYADKRKLNSLPLGRNLLKQDFSKCPRQWATFPD